jgi:putative tricarboxylic transport membrane protein
MSQTTPNLKRRPDGAALIIAAVLAAIAAVVFWQTAQMRVVATYAQVGPTTFPYIVAAGLAVLSIITAISAWRGKFPERERDNYAPLLWIVGGLVVQMLLLDSVGFSIATGILFAATAKGFGRGPIWKTFPIGAVFSFIIWLIFARVLQLSLPAGPLESLIP